MPYHFSNPRGLRSSLPGKGAETRCFSVRLPLASAVWLASFLWAQVTHPQAKGEASFSGLHFGTRRPLGQGPLPADAPPASWAQAQNCSRRDGVPWSAAGPLPWGPVGADR